MRLESKPDHGIRRVLRTVGRWVVGALKAVVILLLLVVPIPVTNLFRSGGPKDRRNLPAEKLKP